MYETTVAIQIQRNRLIASGDQGPGASAGARAGIAAGCEGSTGSADSFTAALSARSTRVDALLHVSEPRTIVTTRLADVCADLANCLVASRSTDHEIRRGHADVRAIEHELDVGWVRVLATELEAIMAGHAQAHLVAPETLLDAVLHRWASMSRHRVVLAARIAARNDAPTRSGLLP